MAATVHRQLKVIAFNPNSTCRHHYELSKQVQGLHIDVALISETYLKSHKTFFIPNYHFYQADHFPGRKHRTAVAVTKGIPLKHANRPTLVSIEATVVCILTGNSEIFSVINTEDLINHLEIYAYMPHKFTFNHPLTDTR
jgi:hypothetical protein